MVEDSLPQPKADLIITGATEVLTCAPTADDLIGRRAGALVAISGEVIVAVGSPSEVVQQVDTTTAQVWTFSSVSSPVTTTNV